MLEVEFTLSPKAVSQVILSGKQHCLFFLSGALKWKEDLTQKATEVFLRQQQSAPSLRKLIYGTGKKTNKQNHHCASSDHIKGLTEQTWGGEKKEHDRWKLCQTENKKHCD